MVFVLKIEKNKELRVTFGMFELVLQYILCNKIINDDENDENDKNDAF
jgi:hypothetical protein